MATTIITKFGSGAPTASDVVRGELAVDTENGRLYTEDSGGSVVEIGLNPSGNVDVTGTVTADGLTVDGSGGFGLTAPTISEGFQIHVDEAGNGVWGGFGNVYLTSNYKFNSTNKFAGTGYAQILEAVPSTGAFTFKTSSASGTADATATMQNRLNIATNGDISFYEDTGTTAKFFWDASAESLGIGTTTPASNTVHIASATNTTALKIQNSATSGRTYQLMAHGGGSSLAGKFSVYDETAGIHRIALDSSGNVGIGTTSPTADLSVGSTTTSSGDIHLRTTKTAAEITPSNTDAGGLDIDVGWVSGGQGPLTFSLSGSEKMRIDASGNVGIGTASPDAALDVLGSSGDQLRLRTAETEEYKIGRNSSTGFLDLYGTQTGYTGYTFGGVDGERMRIDSSGNLLVGTNTTTAGNEGMVYFNGSSLRVTRDSDEPLNLDRLTSDGNIIQIRKDGSDVGSIGAVSGYLYVGGTAGNDAFLSFGADGVRPSTSAGAARDAAIDLGGSTNRFKDLYLSNESRVAGSARGRLENFYRSGNGRTFTITGGSNGALAELEFTASNHVGYVRKYYHCYNASGNWTVTERESSTSGTAQTVTISNNGTGTVTVNVTSSTGSYSGGVLNYKMKYEFISVA